MNLPEADWTSGFKPMSYLDSVNAQQAVKEQRALGDLTIATKQQQMNTENALAPFKVQEAGYAAQNAGEEAGLKQQDYENQMIAGVAQRARAADPGEAPTVWDDGMKALGDKGIKTANQYVGQYRPDLAEHVYDTFSGQPQGGGGKGGSAQSAPGFDSEAFARSLNNVPLPALQKSYANLNQAIEGYNRVKDEQSWRAEVDTLKQAGMLPPNAFPAGGDWRLQYAEATKLIKGSVAAQRDIIGDHMIAASGGLPGMQEKPTYEPSFQYIGTDAQGRPITMNARTGQGQVGYAGAVLPKPSAATSTFQIKRNAWLSVHPGDDAGALEFANGKRRMDPGQMTAEALRLANQQMADATLAGEVIANPDQWVRQKAQQNYVMISGAGAAPVGAPAGGGNGARGVTPRPAGRMNQADVQASIANARAALKAHPDKRAIILSRLKAAGVSTAGL